MPGVTASEQLPLIVAEVGNVAENITRFSLRDPKGAELPQFTPGAHIGIQAPNGLSRKYSLCNDPDARDHYEIAVKRETDGRGGSASLTNDVRVGTMLSSTPPRNDFALVPRVANFLFIAGGIGITPILSMVRFLHRTGSARFKLYYCTRNPEETAYRDELAAPELRGQVVIHHDEGDAERSLDLWPLLERSGGAHLYCCGPRPMLEAVRDMTGHWSSFTVHIESFLDGAATRKADDRAFRVRLARSGNVVDVPADRSILEALRSAGCDVPSSCESGTCGTCRTRLIAGEADHRDLVLDDDERERNIMVCVSRARSDELVIDR